MKKYALLQTAPKLRLLGMFLHLPIAEREAGKLPPSVKDYAIATIGEPDAWTFFMSTFSTAEMRELLGTLPGSANGLPLAPGQRALADQIATKLADREPFFDQPPHHGEALSGTVDPELQPAPTAPEETTMGTPTTATTTGAPKSAAKKTSPTKPAAKKTAAAKPPTKASKPGKAGRPAGSKTRPAPGPIADAARKGSTDAPKGKRDPLGRKGSVARTLAEAIAAGKSDADAAAIATKAGFKVGGRGMEAYAGYTRWQMQRKGLLTKPAKK